MIFKQLPLELSNTQTTDSTEDTSSAFSHLLSTKIETAKELTMDTGLTIRETTSRMNLVNMFMSNDQIRLDDLLIDEDLGDELSQVLSNAEAHNNASEEMKKYFESLFGDTMSAEELLERLNELDANSEMLDGNKTIQDIIPVLDQLLMENKLFIQGNIPIDQLNATQQSDVDIDEQVIIQQFAQLLNGIQARLIDLTSDLNMEQMTRQVVALIERWVTLEQTVKDSNTSLQSLLSQLEVDEEEMDVLKDVMQSLQKRHSMINEQQANAPTEHKLIHKWLADVLPTLSQQNKMQHSVQQPAPITQMPLSELEQYVIHMNQSHGTQTAGKELMDQFQQIIKSSRFLANNGMNQLSIALKPQNMGDMMVKFTQMDGEMTVKIIVSSNMTRHMLESNIKELRHMFSPHQVVIEKQDIGSQYIQKELHDETTYSDEEHQEKQQQDDPKQQNDNDFETTFLELLMNEKV